MYRRYYEAITNTQGGLLRDYSKNLTKLVNKYNDISKKILTIQQRLFQLNDKLDAAISFLNNTDTGLDNTLKCGKNI